jgi:hypothetical protein
LYGPLPPPGLGVWYVTETACPPGDWTVRGAGQDSISPWVGSVVPQEAAVSAQASTTALFGARDFLFKGDTDLNAKPPPVC